jgi:hypothetical protein
MFQFALDIPYWYYTQFLVVPFECKIDVTLSELSVFSFSFFLSLSLSLSLSFPSFLELSKLSRAFQAF